MPERSPNDEAIGRDSQRMAANVLRLNGPRPSGGGLWPFHQPNLLVSIGWMSQVDLAISADRDGVAESWRLDLSALRF